MALGASPIRAFPTHRGGKADAFKPTAVRKGGEHLLFVTADLLFVFVNTLIITWIRALPAASVWWFSGWRNALQTALSPEFLGVVPVYATLVVLALESQDLYRAHGSRSGFQESVGIAKAVLLATVLLTACLYLLDMKTFSRLVIVFSGIVNTAALIAWRMYRRHSIRRELLRGRAGMNALIIGAGPAGRAVAQYLGSRPDLGYVVKGFIDQRNGNPSILGRIQDLDQVARAHFVDELIVAAPLDRTLVRQIMRTARRRRLQIKVVPELLDILSGGFSIDHLGEIPVIALSHPPIPSFQMFLKRVIDVVGSVTALLTLSPVIAFIAVLIKFDSRGPVFYSSLRVGKKGRIFRCYKFRTMVNEAEEMQSSLKQFNERGGVLFKITHDPRVTRFGRFLRKSSLDEVPQFWNVLKGDISLVGPRPALVGEFEQYSLKHLERLEVLPGITGLWQVTARRDPSFERYVDLDRHYVENWSLWMDIEILLRTIPAVLRGTGQ